QITEREQRVLVVLGKEALGAIGAAVMRPLRHGAHGTVWAVAVIDLEAEALLFELGLNALERRRHLAPKNALGSVIAVERAADELVGAGIADVMRNGRIGVVQEDKIVRHGGLRRRVAKTQRQCAGHDGRPGPGAARHRRGCAAADTVSGLPRRRAWTGSGWRVRAAQN